MSTEALRLLWRTVGFVALPALLVAVWWLSTRDSTDFYWPPLQEILGLFPETWLHGRMTEEVIPSLLRLLLGYGSAVVAGVTCGIVIASHRRLGMALEPVLAFARALPPPVLIPIITLFFGIGDSMKVAVIGFGCVWPILLNTIAGVRSIDEVQQETFASYRMSGWVRLRELVLPAASPRIFAGARQALSIGVILMVISEMFSARNGIGFVILQFQRGFAVPEMWTGILLLGLIGIALALVFRFVESRLLHWYEGMRRAERGTS